MQYRENNLAYCKFQKQTINVLRGSQKSIFCSSPPQRKNNPFLQTHLVADLTDLLFPLKLAFTKYAWKSHFVAFVYALLPLQVFFYTRVQIHFVSCVTKWKDCDRDCVFTLNTCTFLTYSYTLLNIYYVHFSRCDCADSLVDFWWTWIVIKVWSIS